MKMTIIVARVGLLGSGTPDADGAGRPKADRDDQTVAPMVTRAGSAVGTPSMAVGAPSMKEKGTI